MIQPEQNTYSATVAKDRTMAIDPFRQACWLRLSSAIHRYLIVNSEGRLDGSEKAMRHMELCQFYVAVVHQLNDELDARRGAGEPAYQKVHTATQALTDNLDDVIGFPLKGRPDYDKLAPLFFDHFHRLALGALSVHHDVGEVCRDLEQERLAALHQLAHLQDTASDVIEGLEVMQLPGAMPARVRKLRTAVSASLSYTSEGRLPVTTYVVVVRSKCGGGERLYDRQRHHYAAQAGALANTLNVSGELDGAVAFYREATADDLEQTAR